jgi:hypothetical protein
MYNAESVHQACTDQYLRQRRSVLAATQRYINDVERTKMETNLLLHFVCCCLGTPRPQHTISTTTIVSIGTDRFMTVNEQKGQLTFRYILYAAGSAHHARTG